MRIALFTAALIGTASLVALSAQAQQAAPGGAPPQQQAAPAPPMPYGLPIDLALARRASVARRSFSRTGSPAGRSLASSA